MSYGNVPPYEKLFLVHYFSISRDFKTFKNRSKSSIPKILLESKNTHHLLISKTFQNISRKHG